LNPDELQSGSRSMPDFGGACCDLFPPNAFGWDNEPGRGVPGHPPRGVMLPPRGVILPPRGVFWPEAAPPRGVNIPLPARIKLAPIEEKTP